MSITVMKFGGTSVADAERIRSAARRAIRTHKKGQQVVMVVSAMGKSTDTLMTLANQATKGKQLPKREVDQLLATGEQVTISLMAMAIEAMGASAISFTAGQIDMVTDDAHTKAKIKSIAAHKIHDQLNKGKIVIVAGFQGVTEEGHVTTLGRGGSNVTLVALAAALKAEHCENYTDVDGVFTADPRIVPNARKISSISYDEMLELATQGVNVLHNRAVEFAKKFNVPIHLRNSQNNKKGTMIVAENESMEKIVVRGAALKNNIARVSLRDIPDKPGNASRIFHAIAKQGIVVDDIIQQAQKDGKNANITFTIESGDLDECKKVIKTFTNKHKSTATYVENLAKISVVGTGMQIHTGVAETMFNALYENNINIENITTSEIKLSVLIHESQGKDALRAVHDAFNLGKKAKLKTTRKKATRKSTAKSFKVK